MKYKAREWPRGPLCGLNQVKVMLTREIHEGAFLIFFCKKYLVCWDVLTQFIEWNSGNRMRMQVECVLPVDSQALECLVVVEWQDSGNHLANSTR